MDKTLIPPALHDLIAAGGVVLTSNDALSRDLQIRYSLDRRDRGDAVWPRARIQSFRRYTISLWESTWPSGQLLNPVQELALYKSVIDRSELGRTLISSTSTARGARRAGALLTTYGMSASLLAPHYSIETQAFAEWQAAVDSQLSEMDWTTQDRLVEDLIRLVSEGRIELPPSVYTIGFLHVTPQQQAFFDALQGAGVAMHQESARPSGACVFKRPVNPRDEALGVAQQIQLLLAPHRDSPESAPRIGVLVADSKDARLMLEPAFTELLAPQLLVPSDIETPVPWRYERGQPLSEHEIAASALTLLSLSRYDNESDLVSRFLLNRRFGNGPESISRAAADYLLRQRTGRKIGLTQILHVVEMEGAAHSPVFAERLRCLDEDLDKNNGNALPSVWAARYRKRLLCMGWPGGDPTGSALQAARGFDECLRLYAAMDRQMGSISAPRAWAWLRELCHSRDHSPHVRYSQPVHVVDWADAPGMQFDHVFVLGASATHLPSSGVPSPFLPLDLQIKSGVPEASADGSLEQARQLVAAIQQTAPTIVWSCPYTASDGSHYAPSPLLTGWPAMADPACNAESSMRKIVHMGVATSIPPDDPVPPVLDPVAEGIHGGVSILDHFAYMPFAAFIRHRLDVQPFPVPEAGLTAREQGRVVHAALERFWEDVRTRTALRALGDDRLRETIRSVLKKVTEGEGRLPEWRYGRRLALLERHRLESLLVEWLSLERERAEDFEVVHVELKADTVVSGLPVSVRIDRVDKVTTDQGEMTLLLDYKTGRSVSPYGWQPDILTAPQLPFYASCIDLVPFGISPARGIAFAHVAEARCAFHARLSWAAYLVPIANGRASPVAGWDRLTQEWRMVIEDSAVRFLKGDARAFYDVSMGREYADLNVFLRQDTAP